MIVSIKPEQVKRVNARVRYSCANCLERCCLLLDDGDSHPCVQLLTNSRLCCNYLQKYVLPADRELYETIIKHNKD